MSCCECALEPKGSDQKGVLIRLLVINGTMFIAEVICAILADSTGLLADSLDMLADALVYGISLYAVGRSNAAKTFAARWSGFFQITLAGGVLLDVLRRFFLGSDPESAFMMIVGACALVANVACLKLISKHRDGEVHMRASWIFSKNDVIANLGVILAGGLVQLTASRIPDLVIGLCIAAFVFRGGVAIVQDAARERDCAGAPAS